LTSTRHFIQFANLKQPKVYTKRMTQEASKQMHGARQGQQAHDSHYVDWAERHASGSQPPQTRARQEYTLGQVDE